MSVNNSSTFQAFGREQDRGKNIAVANNTIAGPEGMSQMAEIKTPHTEVVIPMSAEYTVKVLRLWVS